MSAESIEYGLEKEIVGVVRRRVSVTVDVDVVAWDMRHLRQVRSRLEQAVREAVDADPSVEEVAESGTSLRRER